MEWFNILLSALGGSIVTGVGGILYIRPRLKSEKAGASKATTDAMEAQFDLLVKRVQSMENLYKQQGDVMDKMRLHQLDLETEVQTLKEQGIAMEAENRQLKEKLSRVEEENVSCKQQISALKEELNSYRKRGRKQ